ncbi:TonB-dependent receptor [Sphingomonas asaccharolytica]|uniref:TonB-dependent receptor n=1 Tax=Sphingomonas asaccharolytica TaxID=40681 RepID=UPI0008324F9A|nr:TonB-dependent receptor plug domain-containing protein [Sphingomonas asaccharolytica]
MTNLMRASLRAALATTILAGGALALAMPAAAQTTSTIQGHVDGAAADATVVLTDTNTGHQDTVKVDANGNYVLVGVPPSTYRVASGDKSVIVVVPLGQAVTADLIAVPENTKDIVVTGSRARDVKTPAISTNISRFQLENLPNGDRNFLNFAALAPGVTVEAPTLGGKARRVQAGGVNSDNTNTFIDGISIKNLVNHGGTLGQNLSSGNPFPASAVDQFDVQTQNFKAEFEQAGSAVISSVTKTGGNEFHGEIFGEWQPKAFISENFDDRPGGRNNATRPYKQKPDFDTKYYGGNLGGPIIKDKLTFFVDFEGTKKTFGSNDISVYPNGLSSPNAAALAYLQSAQSKYNGSFAADFNEKLYFGKLTFFATSADTVNVSAFIRNESNLQINGRETTTEASTRNRNDEHRYQLTWTHRGANWLNEFIFARDAAANGAIPNTSGSSYVVVDAGLSCDPDTHVCTPNNPNVGSSRVLALGGTNFTQDDHQYQTLFKDNVTFFGGAHTVKAGVKVNFTKLQRLEDNNSQGTFFYNGNTFTGIASSTPYAASINTAAVSPVTAKNTEVGLFVQDDWKPDEHWQVSAGLRWDYESNSRNEKFVTPANIAAAIRAYPGWKAAGINPDDYISTGSNRKPFTGAFQPRLGISYDVKGDRDLVFTIGGGRYYNRSLFIDSALETIKDLYESVVTINTPPNCALGTQGCVTTIPTDVSALRALAAMQAGEVHLMNNNTKVPYSDQLSFGIRKRLGKINTSISFSYIKSHNIYQEVVGNRNPDGSYSPLSPLFSYGGNVYSSGIFYGSAAINTAPLFGTDGRRYGAIFIGNSDGKATYAALYLQADKPYTDESGWGFSTTLTISNARSNDSRNGANIGDPFNFDAPTIGLQGWGRSSGLERWRFVGTGTVRLPLDIRATTFITLSSGPYYGGVICGIPAPSVDGCAETNFGIYKPGGIGYANIDFNFSKTFKMPWAKSHELTVYFQALNAFDFVNRNYSMWGGGFRNVGDAGPSGRYELGQVASQGRNFKVGARYKF